jgi:hypothetical protein
MMPPPPGQVIPPPPPPLSDLESQPHDGGEVFAFVLMPFKLEFSDAYRLGIKEPAAALGIRAERVDEQIFTEGILDRIYRQIDAADIVIADMSEQNPNVFYEVGYAHAKGKLCLLVTKNASDIPFDLKHKRHVVYGGSIQTLRELLTKDMEWAKTQVIAIRKSRLRIENHEPTGSLTKGDYIVRGDLYFTFDIHNDSDAASAEIEAVYFYSGDKWTIYNGMVECPKTASDVIPFSTRHFVDAPVTKLPAKGWAQIKLKSSGTLAWKRKGEALADEYDIRGQVLLRVVTSKGPVDHQFSISVKLGDDIPF